MLNLTFSFTGEPSDAQVATGSVDQTGTYVFEVEPEGLGPGPSKIGGYWNVANGYDTMLNYWNPSSAAEDVVATIFYGDGSGQYQIPLHLAPFASGMIDMMMLIENGQPDPNGNTIPMAVQNGSVVFSNAQGKTVPMTLNVAVGAFDVTTATCCTQFVNCCGDSNFIVDPAGAFCPVGQSMQCTAQATNCDGTIVYPSYSSWSSSNTAIATITNGGMMTGVAPGQVTITANFTSAPVETGTFCAPHTCITHAESGSSPETVTPAVSTSGPHEVPLLASGTSGPNQVSVTADVSPPGGTYSWSTPDTSKVSLTNTTSPTVVVTSVSASSSRGDVTLTVSYTYNSVQGSASTFMTVQRPSGLTLSSNISSGAASCPTGQAGPDRKLWWQVQDQFTDFVQFGGMPFYDTIGAQGASGCNPPGNTNGCNIANFTTGSGSTDSSGQFQDDYHICSPCCYNGGKCTTTANQYYYVNGFQILKNPSYTCSGVTINGQ